MTHPFNMFISHTIKTTKFQEIAWHLLGTYLRRPYSIQMATQLPVSFSKEIRFDKALSLRMYRPRWTHLTPSSRLLLLKTMKKDSQVQFSSHRSGKEPMKVVVFQRRPKFCSFSKFFGCSVVLIATFSELFCETKVTWNSELPQHYFQ